MHVVDEEAGRADPGKPGRLTERTFHRKFVAATGQTPARFVETTRLDAAHMLLSGGLSPKTVAARVGFFPPGHLAEAFERRFGVAPRLFRDMHPELQDLACSGNRMAPILICRSDEREDREMKPFLAFVGGFVLSLGIFLSGIVMAVTYFHAEPVKLQQAGQTVAGLWTAEPQKVDPSQQPFERVAAVTGQADEKQPRDVTPDEPVDAGDNAGGEVDRMTTAALASDDPALRSPEVEAMAAAHADWCSSRYRSYRPRDDSYTPYRGGRRRCVSPYSEGAQGIAPVPVSAEPEADGYVHADEEASVAYVEYASDAVQLDGDHIDYCFSRYRSYRPEDNTYQPFGGGPRRQCQ
jgi:AraC-like DNA-binding protein